MKRKINKVGHNTLTVSLPSKWAKTHNIKAGDELEVTEQDNSLNISLNEPKIKHKEMDYKLLSSNGYYVAQAIRAFYHSGIDKLNLTFNKKETIILIQKEIERLLGYEVLEMTDNSCKIRIISEPVEEEFDMLSRKVFLLTISMAELVLRDIINGNTEHHKQIEAYHDQIHRFATFCRRMIGKRRLYKKLKGRSAYIILLFCIVIKNNFSYMHRYLRKKNDYKIDKKVIIFFKNTINMYRNYYETFFSKDVKRLVQINETRDKLDHDMMDILEKTTGENSVVMRYLSEAVKIIAISGGTLIPFFIDID